MDDELIKLLITIIDNGFDRVCACIDRLDDRKLIQQHTSTATVNDNEVEKPLDLDKIFE